LAYSAEQRAQNGSFEMVSKSGPVKANARGRFDSPIRVSNVTIKYPALQSIVNRYPCCIPPVYTGSRFEAEQIEFAFPSQTLYVKKD